jgi:hypothetical protein
MDGDEDANIRAAQAILFRSRTKSALCKTDQYSRTEHKGTPRRLDVLTPKKKEIDRFPSATADVKSDTTPVKVVMNGLAGTPRSNSSVSKQR